MTKYIASYKELPQHMKRILIEYGNESKTIRYNDGVTIIVAKSRDEETQEFRLQSAIEEARLIAKEDGIATIFVKGAFNPLA
jgi:hypothetical protein